MTTLEDKKEAIFFATLKLVSRYGFHGTAVSMIAKEANVSAGIIYHYFENKDDLINELYIALKKKMSEQVSKNYDAALPLAAKIRKDWEGIIRYHIENPVESAFLDQFGKSPYYTKDIENKAHVYFKRHLDLIEQGKKEMIIKDLPLQVYIAFSIDIASSLAQKHFMGLLNMDEKLTDKIIESTWEAVRL